MNREGKWILGGSSPQGEAAFAASTLGATALNPAFTEGPSMMASDRGGGGAQRPPSGVPYFHARQKSSPSTKSAPLAIP